MFGPLLEWVRPGKASMGFITKIAGPRRSHVPLGIQLGCGDRFRKKVRARQQIVGLHFHPGRARARQQTWDGFHALSGCRDLDISLHLRLDLRRRFFRPCYQIAFKAGAAVNQRLRRLDFGLPVEFPNSAGLTTSGTVTKGSVATACLLMAMQTNPSRTSSKPRCRKLTP